MAYDPKTIEPRWQGYWEENQTFRTGDDQRRPKYYVLDMFPYPSGDGLHVGHPEGYTATDVVARYKRMMGFNVLHPMGWDAYGLPAERYAVRTGVHPAITTRSNIANFRKQVRRLGFSYDWSREISTTDPEFVRWTQWIFLQMYKAGLAYQADVAVNWCPAQGTVLANEEVKDGRYVETGDPVERRTMRQWMLKITAYADRLLADLDELDWPDGIKAMQRNWIGRSEGAEVAFAVEDRESSLTVYTTRPETIFGATFIVLSPEHPAINAIASAGQRGEVDAYRARAAAMSAIEKSQAQGKSGVFTGAYAINPANGSRIPVWVADYALMSYGTGAIMAVPAHDDRDRDFAEVFGLPIVEVVSASGSPSGDVPPAAWAGDGLMVNSGFMDGMETKTARTTAIAWMTEQGVGVGRIEYKLRDWLFSRQRYWGEPFPILHTADGSIVPLPEDALPLLPPELTEYRPTPDGEPPLARAEDWVRTTDPKSGMDALRETNTMPQWAGSCWYFLRFADPSNVTAPIDPDKEKYWLPVDLYVGGAEHAVLHLLYARFWHKVLFDIGVVTSKEPFRKLFNQGMILAFSYKDATGKYHRPEDAAERDGRWYVGETEVERQVEKMSKSKFNVVNPDEVVDQYGADAMRLYELFMGPLDVAKPWQMSGVAGVSRFLHRVWRIAIGEDGMVSSKIVDAKPSPEIARVLHKTIKAVGDDIKALRFNTAISKLMELSNALTGLDIKPRSAVESFVLLLAPFAPHIAEELWRRLAHPESLSHEPWPTYDPALADDDIREIIVQVNGKLRGRIHAASMISDDELVRLAAQEPDVRSRLTGKAVLKEIIVPGRLVNFVLAP
ncbi:leucine--tRNA ligase [Rhizobium chutanense]|uniref:Leucine--tRNA ligase n=1 Tax=Rhizobium chutanense TaxID=2035448 RepID=A0A2A6J7U9_9HYPH|nr:leucine--tRNA ligase [Rhizobium chutanense]PDT02071.1 leucine--tRNA ligase [Rhizobium chutanense]